MALALVARNVQFSGQILGNAIPIDINILNTYKSAIDFTLFGSTYTFTIEKWAKRGLNSLQNHADIIVYTRNSSHFDYLSCSWKSYFLYKYFAELPRLLVKSSWIWTPKYNFPYEIRQIIHVSLFLPISRGHLWIRKLF